MLKKFKDFIIENNVEILDPIIKTHTQKSNSEDDRYMMMFIVKDNIIYDNTIMLLNDEILDKQEGKMAISSTYILASFVGDCRVYKVEMSKEHVIEARNQTGLELNLAKSYVLDPKQELYTWLLENMDTLPPPQKARIIENVEVLDPTIKPPVIKSKTGGDNDYMMFFLIRNDRINGNGMGDNSNVGPLVLVNNDYLEMTQSKGKKDPDYEDGALSTLFYMTRLGDNRPKVAFARMSKEYVIAAREQTGQSFELGETNMINQNTDLEIWLLENMELLR
tara:strand:- start:80161 stop:80994 length:834 start_codon:yes stop_codon:yes gene_type:complete